MAAASNQSRGPQACDSLVLTILTDVNDTDIAAIADKQLYHCYTKRMTLFSLMGIVINVCCPPADASQHVPLSLRMGAAVLHVQCGHHIVHACLRCACEHKYSNPFSLSLCLEFDTSHEITTFRYESAIASALANTVSPCPHIRHPPGPPSLISFKAATAGPPGVSDELNGISYASLPRMQTAIWNVLL